MKTLLFLLALICFNSSAEAPPPANAFKGVMYGYEVSVYVSEIFGTQYGLRAVYKSGGEWHYLAEPDFYESDVDSKQKANEKFIQMITIINSAAYDALNDISLEPNCCSARIQWLLENKLKIVDGELVLE